MKKNILALGLALFSIHTDLSGHHTASAICFVAMVWVLFQEESKR